MQKALIRFSTLVLTTGFFILFSSSSLPDEGMFPLSEINKIDLKKAGLAIDQNEIYNPNGISLIDALVNISGCTGSFVSESGLIITNHHCAFNAVQLASTPEKDFITNGFYANTPEQEIEAKGVTCRITESYEDVSAKILSMVRNTLDPLDRMKTINSKIAEIVREEEAKDPGIKAEVSEMFIGKTYVLFRYKTIPDVRLVYVPRRTIGEFGGESDNWVWPRHNGDYSFMRAYVGPDGKPAPYSTKNVPYKPKKFLKINPKGCSEEDFVFILGYPGRTFRHRSSQYIKYQEKFLLPYISSLYEWEIAQMQASSALDKTLEIKQASRVKRLANVMKNYRGKLQGLFRTELVQEKEKEEKDLQAFINSDPKLKEHYGNLMNDIDKVYAEIFSDAIRDLWFSQIFPSTNLLAVANVVNNLQIKLNEFDKPKREAYLKENAGRIKDQLESAYSTYVEETDKRILKKMLTDALGVPDNQRVEVIDKLFGSKGEKGVEEYIDRLYKSTKFQNPQWAFSITQMKGEEIAKLKDPLLRFADELNKQLIIIQQVRQKREGTINKLMADFVDVKSLFKKSNFVPDANGTLRLTYGYVRGYSPADAVYNAPFTTLKGVIEKGNMSDDYKIPDILVQLSKKKDYGQWMHPKLNDVPVAFLYNLDTSGGNSGSPVMNNKGELIGVNFDRAYSATINDFAFNESYSRAIGVDIRYVLWVAQKVDKAERLLKELGVNPDQAAAENK